MADFPAKKGVLKSNYHEPKRHYIDVDKYFYSCKAQSYTYKIKLTKTTDGKSLQCNPMQSILPGEQKVKTTEIYRGTENVNKNSWK